MTIVIKTSRYTDGETNKQRCKRIAFILAELSYEGAEIRIGWAVDIKWHFDHPDEPKNLSKKINKFKNGDFSRWANNFPPLLESYSYHRNDPDIHKKKYVLRDIERLLMDGIDLLKYDFAYIDFDIESEHGYMQYRLGYTEDDQENNVQDGHR